jgi:hypothetical protein
LTIEAITTVILLMSYYTREANQDDIINLGSNVRMVKGITDQDQRV